MPTNLSDDRHIQSPKVDPKLRMFANCSQEVNEVRSQFQGSLAIEGKPRKVIIRDANPEEMPVMASKFRKKKSKNDPPSNILANVFIRLAPDIYHTKIPGQIARKGNLVSAQVRLTQLNDLKEKSGVINIESSRSLKVPNPTIDTIYASRTRENILKQYRGKFTRKNKVLIGIIDVGGFDFSHPDFLDAKGNTRFHSIWDQGGDFRDPPQPFLEGTATYGSEFTADLLNNAIKSSKRINIPAYQIEKQSALTVGSHGTHVASIAAGNNGVCPDAMIAGVIIALKESDIDRRKSFYDSSCVVHAVEYITRLADKLKLPVSINISLGTNGHAHDGTDAASRWIDTELLLPGRVVTVAAGNSGQDKPEVTGDLGYVMGRIHTRGRIKGRGLSEDIQWLVVGNGVSDISENELEIWYPCQDRFAVQVKPPDGEWSKLIRANEFIENMQLGDGSFISIYNDLYHPSNGMNLIAVYLTPYFSKEKVIPVRAGLWQVRIYGDDIRNGEYHAWIERDDPRPLGATGEDRALWNYPSYFGEHTNIDNTSISSLACARHVISVGNLDHLNERVHPSSSQGPTRDNRLKPEVLAPGTKITAAKGFAGSDDLWISMTGTSMAAPIACGVAAQMLQAEPKLTAGQISGIMVRTSKPLPGRAYAWTNDHGFGVVQAQACVDEARNIYNKKDVGDENKNLSI